MPRNDDGVYNLPGEVNPVVTGTTITSNWANTTLEDVADALTNSISADGVTTPSADLPMGGRKHTGVGDAVAAAQYTSLGQIRAGTYNRVTVTSGVNALVGTLTGLTAYTDYMGIAFVPLVNNTDTVTIAVNGLGQLAVLSSSRTTLLADDLAAGNLYLGYVDGTSLILQTPVESAGGGAGEQKSVTGWVRPADGYPDLVVPDQSGTEITIPDGTGIFVSATGDVFVYSWDSQTIDLADYVTVGVDTVGQASIFISQTGAFTVVFGIPDTALYRDNCLLGTAMFWLDQDMQRNLTEAPRPAHSGGDGYLGLDVANLLSGTCISGGGATLLNTAGPVSRIDISDVYLFQANADQDPSQPNLVNFATVSAAQYQFVVICASDGTTWWANAFDTNPDCPINRYDTGSGVGLIPDNEAKGVIHRLYAPSIPNTPCLWVLGRKITYEGSTFFPTTLESALSWIELDRATYVPPAQVAGLALVAEIFSTGYTQAVNSNPANWPNANPSANFGYINRAKPNFYIGAVGGIAEAPIDGNAYGRQNAAWAQVVAANNPVFTGNIQVNKSNPKATLNNTGGAGTYAQFGMQSGGFDWVTLRADKDTNQTWLQLRDPSNGTVQATITVDNTNGDTTFPGDVTVNGNSVGDVFGPVSSTSGALAIFSDTTGKVIAEGDVPGNVITYDVQTTTTDNDPTHVMLATGYGLGTTGGLLLPSGTTAQRVATESYIRRNTDLAVIEAYLDGSWVTLGTSPALSLPDNYFTGFLCTNSVVNPTSALDIGIGQCANQGTYGVPNSANTSFAELTSALGKTITAVWADGGTTATPTGGLAAALGAPVNGTYYREFVIWKDDGTVNFGWDAANAPNATNLLATGSAAELAGYKHFCQINWTYYTASAIKPFFNDGDVRVWDAPIKTTYTGNTAGALLVVGAPPSTTPNFSALLNSTSGLTTIQFSDPRTTNSLTAPDLYATPSYSTAAAFSVKLDSSSRLRQRSSTNTAYGDIYVKSWKYNRNG